MFAKLLQSCLTLCNPVYCSPLGSSVHGILQAWILEWVAVPSSRGSFQPRYWTHVSCGSFIAGRFFAELTYWQSSYLSPRSLCLLLAVSMNSVFTLVSSLNKLLGNRLIWYSGYLEHPGKKLMGWTGSMHFNMQAEKGLHLHRTGMFSRAGNLEVRSERHSLLLNVSFMTSWAWWEAQ